ncbi:MAG: ArsR family transcriptional regulator [Haloplanus sp.]
MDLSNHPDERVRLLADATNREILTVLGEADQPLDVETLAARLVDRDIAVVRAAEHDDRTDRWAASLHHNHLPKLASAGLVAYDPDTNTVASVSWGPDVEWHDAMALPEIASRLTGDGTSADDTTGVVDGQGSISEYGRRLTADAETEVFCICVSTDFLDPACFRSAKNALDRGVTMAIGSQNPEIRDLIRERLPRATTWEPQLDWLNTPSYPRVGRLVLADRRNVMLSILGDTADGGEDYEDTAVVGNGEQHPLVVLVRELLGARLDHLDHQSEEFLSEPIL